ncbi:hypothetical protein N332_07753, partial [Mesitornis unicolor]
EGSVQILELQAVITALQQWENDCLNLVVDSLYVVGVVKRMHQSILGHVSNPVLFATFTHLWHVLQQRRKPLFVTHIKGHTNLPGGLVEGNALADAIVSANVVDTSTPGGLAEAQKSHAFYHQPSAALKAPFQISKADAKPIIATCPDCAQLFIQATGANPQGLQPRQIRQTDVTEYPKFGCQKYLHVTVDTCSGMIWATALNSTSASAAKKHWLQSFAVLGKPEQIKTDNGPAYHCNIISQFMTDWQIKHVRGVPYNSTGQAIVERAHSTLKHHLD